MLRPTIASFLFSALLLVTVAPACAETITLDIQGNVPTEAAGAIRQARERIAAGDMARAISGLNSFVNSHPGEPSAKRFLGDLYFRSGQIDLAKTIYLQLLAVNPRDKETHNRLGMVYAVENDIDDAIVQYNAALPGTDSVDSLVEMHARRGDLNAYRDAIARMAATSPYDPEILTEIGQIYNALHEPYLASTYFKRALTNDPQNTAAENGLGVAMLDMKDFAAASAVLQRCIHEDPSNYDCRNNLGAVQLESGAYAQAKASLDEAYHLAPERAETFVNYGYLADAQGDWQKAAAQYAKAIALFPYLLEAYVDLGITYEQHGLYALAQATLIKGIASVHDDGRMHDLLGDAFAAQGDRVDAVKQYRLAIAGSDPVAVSLAQGHVAALGTAKP
jgi:tetratricopeptide (TPR) repeat protein